VELTRQSKTRIVWLDWKAGSNNLLTIRNTPYNQRHKLNVKGWKKICHTCGNWKQAEVTIFTSNKAYFKQKTKTVRRNKKGQYMLIKGTIQWEDITILNIYALNINAPKFIWLILLRIEEQIGPHTIIVGDLNTPFVAIDWTSRKKINKDILELNNTMDEMDLADIYKVFHPAARDCTFFLNSPQDFHQNRLYPWP
jgi:hypothetical protein